MKNICIIFLIVLQIQNGYGQLLSKQETIDYINKSCADAAIPKDVMGQWQQKSYYVFSVTNNGYVEIRKKVIRYGSTSSFYENKEYIFSRWKFHLSDININNIYINSKGDLKIICETENCILYDIYGETNNNTSSQSFNLRSFDGFEQWDFMNIENYNLKKIKNALCYLFSVMEESGEAKRNDSDPFAPENIVKSASIKSNEINSTESVQKIGLTNSNNLHYLPVMIDKLKVNFILDSGASEVSISNELEKKLKLNGTISDNDYLSPGLYRLADGTVNTCRRVKISKIKIGGWYLTNIVVVINDHADAPSLLGKNVLNRFKKWSIDNAESVLILEK